MVRYLHRVRDTVDEARKWPPPPPPLDDIGDLYRDEPRMGASMINELQRMKRRAKARPIAVLVVACLMSAAIVYKYSTKPKIYKARVTLRISQGTLSDERGSPLPIKSLTDYIWLYVLNKQVLRDKVLLNESKEIKGIVAGYRDTYETFGLDPAVAEFREWLGIRPYQNYFLFARKLENTPRSVRLSITYTHPDPDAAYKLARLLADIVVDNESARRLKASREAAATAERVITRLRNELKQERELLGQAQYDLIRAEVIGDSKLMRELEGKVLAFTDSVETKDNRYKTTLGNQRRITDGLRLEENSLAVIWERAGELRPRAFPPPGPVRLTILAVMCFCIFVPVFSILFGAFDSRIHELDDVTRLDMPIVGHIPSFEGERVGSLLDRGALTGRGLLGRIRFIKNRRLRDNRVA